ncbi:MAG TPA: hypothetical protein VM734_12060 [Kofleriaceae bacterium]|nr:hypothetical protein [Kofleriaceae bacterium]
MKSLVGERRAIVAAILAFYGLILFLLGGGVPPELKPMIFALAAIYGVGFFGVVAGWFWGRWYASGVGMWGVVTAVMGMWQVGPEPVFVFLAVTNAILPLFLAGDAMAAGYDGRPDWRVRFHLDDLAVHRLGKSVTRAAMSLPWLLLWALAPKQPADGLTLIPVALAGAGLWGLFRLRTWSLFALTGAAGATAVTAGATDGPGTSYAVIATVLLLGAVAPFARAIARQLVAVTRSA